MMRQEKNYNGRGAGEMVDGQRDEGIEERNHQLKSYQS